MSATCPACGSEFHYGNGRRGDVECADCGHAYEWTPEDEETDED